MCGIAGIIDFLQKQPLHDLIENMTNQIRHRGPDDEGFALFSSSSFAIFGGTDTPEKSYSAILPYAPKERRCPSFDQPPFLALGHRRLSIIDTTPTGHQPMCYNNQNYWIVFNGEVYNYLELRAELETLGHSFISSSDTEVVMASYMEWGTECLHRFNGMFSFILFDRRRNTVFAARDRFGVKPFYYWRSPKGFLAFASEIKEFTILPGWFAKCNAHRTFDFLFSGITDHTNETMFEGVYQLSGGEFFECTVDEIRNDLPVLRWYDLDSRTSDPLKVNFHQAMTMFRDLFEDAVRLRLRADVPVGTGLSGGLDSSSIVCMANSLLQRDSENVQQHSFSACTEDNDLDERPFIEAVVQHTGIKSHYTFPASDGVFQVMSKMIYHHDEPFPGASVFAEWCVFKLVATTHVKVTLDGHGADEILAGYHSFFWPYFAKMLRGLKMIRFFSELQQISSSKLHLLQGTVLTMIPSSISAFLMHASKKHTEILKCIDKKWAAESGWRQSELTIDWFKKDIRELSLAQMCRKSLPHQLRWCDRDSMAFSVESRAPFLDYRLVEFMLRSPDSFKIQNAKTKYILRRSLAHLLPPEIAERKDKIGFAMPEDKWVNENAPQFAQTLIKSLDILSSILTPNNKLREKKDFTDYNQIIWRIITLGSWVEIFKVKI